MHLLTAREKGRCKEYSAGPIGQGVSLKYRHLSRPIKSQTLIQDREKQLE
jgi:hypothetical protein